MNLHAIRSGGLAGLAFVVVVLVAGFAPGIPPDNSRPASELAAYYDGHRTLFLFASWLSCVAAVLFTWYAIGMYRWLKSGGDDEGLPMFSLASAITANVVALASAAVTGALVFHPASALGPQVGLALADLTSMFGTMIWLPLAAFTFGAASSGARHGTLPGWLVWVGYIAALVETIASLAVMFNSGILVLGGPIASFATLIVFLVWMLLSAFAMIGKGSKV